MRRFAPLAIALLLLFSVSVGAQDKNKTHHPERASSSQPSNQQPQASTVIQVQSPALADTSNCQHTEQTAKAESRPFFTHGELLEGILTFCYIVVNLLIFLAVKRQADIAERQSRDAKSAAVTADKAANAANNNVNALIDSERPWVTATIRKTVVQSTRIGERDQSWFSFILTNVGRTPAEILAVRGDPGLTEKGIDGGFTTEDTPEYGLPVAFRQVRLLAPNQEWILKDVDLSRRAYSYNPKEVEQINDGRLHIFFAGLVLYRDTLRPNLEHETAFCYTYLSTPDDWYTSGPPQFTKYT